MIGSGTIAAEYHILYTAKTGKCPDIRVVRLHSHWIGKEEQIVDAALYDERTHLLVATERTGFEYGEIPLYFGMFLLQCFRDELAGSAGRIKLMADEFVRVP